MSERIGISHWAARVHEKVGNVEVGRRGKIKVVSGQSSALKRKVSVVFDALSGGRFSAYLKMRDAGKAFKAHNSFVSAFQADEAGQSAVSLALGKNGNTKEIRNKPLSAHTVQVGLRNRENLLALTDRESSGFKNICADARITADLLEDTEAQELQSRWKNALRELSAKGEPDTEAAPTMIAVAQQYRDENLTTAGHAAFRSMIDEAGVPAVDRDGAGIKAMADATKKHLDRTSTGPGSASMTRRQRGVLYIKRNFGSGRANAFDLEKPEFQRDLATAGINIPQTPQDLKKSRAAEIAGFIELIVTKRDAQLKKQGQRPMTGGEIRTMNAKLLPYFSHRHSTPGRLLLAAGVKKAQITQKYLSDLHEHLRQAIVQMIKDGRQLSIDEINEELDKQVKVFADKTKQTDIAI